MQSVAVQFPLRHRFPRKRACPPLGDARPLPCEKGFVSAKRSPTPESIIKRSYLDNFTHTNIHLGEIWLVACSCHLSRFTCRILHGLFLLLESLCFSERFVLLPCGFFRIRQLLLG